ncbi:MAG: hypothetical protein JO108_12365 [Acidobacteriaceae bacterium]|nr:hypothetical protein [Acidobacteriaceae bacterium]
MQKQNNNGLYGLILLGLGAGIAAAGFVLLVPVCASWSRSRAIEMFNKSKEGVLSGIENAADRLSDVATRAQQPLGEAAKAAKHTTAIAAGAIETAAHYIRERVQ